MSMQTLTTPSATATTRLHLPPRWRAALLMVASSAAFAGTLASVRQLPELSPIQVAFFRYLFSILLLLPWLLREGSLLPPTKRIGRHILRAVSGLAGMMCLFFAARMMPLADAATLGFTAPLFAVLGGALILRERVSRYRWLCTGLGFLGALVVLRPGAASLAVPGLVALMGALFVAVATLTTKTLARTESTATIVFYFTALVTPLSFAFALPVWQMPQLAAWPWLILVAVLATASQILLTRALRDGDASFLLPFDYAQLVFAALFGFVIFAELPSMHIAVGAVIIFGAGLLSLMETRQPALPIRQSA